MESKKNSVTIIASLVIIAVIVVLYATGVFKRSAPLQTNTDTTASTTALNAGVPVQPLLAGDIAKPATDEAAYAVGPKGTVALLHIFDLSADRGVFSPNELVFAKGSRIQINFKAVDADYDLQIGSPIGAYVSAKTGDIASFGFDASHEGRYEFACVKMCPNGPMKGIIIIK